MTTKLVPPLDAGFELVELYSCPGEVVSIADFSAARLGKLSSNEAGIINEFIATFPALTDIPEHFRQCLSRSQELALSSLPVLTARRSGARSAFVPESSLQLKGCRPVLNDESFPVELLPFGTTQITRGQIPFGIMTEDAVLREILGYCFMKKIGISTQAVPLAVTSYLFEGRLLGYAILLKLQSEDRLESHLEIPHCSIRDMLGSQVNPSINLDDCVVGSELRLLGINLWKCIEGNARILAAMHWNGGFRGILNSNFGNTVLIPDGEGSHSIALADFDTFTVLPVPSTDTPELIDAFVLQCLVEVAMGSLPIMQYVDLPTDCTLEQTADALGAVYFSKSSLWRSYYRSFLVQAAERGIAIQTVVESIDRMRHSSAFVDILGCRVLSGNSVKRIGSDTTYWYPHN